MVYIPSVYVPGQEEKKTQNSYQAHASAPPTYNPNHSATIAATRSPMPSFSMALDVPPPAQTRTDPYPPQYQQASYDYSLPQAVAVPQTTPAYNQYNEYSNSSNQQYAASASYPSSKPPPATNSSSSTYIAGSGSTNGVIVSAGNPTFCHKVDYEIKGHEMQLVEIVLDPNETVIAEAGAMMYLEDDVDFKVKMGDGSNPNQGFFGKLMSAGGRLMTGESLFLTHFTNKHPSMQRRAAFASPYPGTIVPVDLLALQKQFPDPSNTDGKASVICQKDAFLCAAHGTKVSMHFHKKFGAGLLGGEGFILQKCKGDGLVFLHAGGCVISKLLQPGERVRVDTGCLVAFTSGIDYSITMVPGLKSMIFGGEGIVLATLTATRGPGMVWLQSLPFSRMADRILRAAPSAGGRRVDEGTALTGTLGGILGGDHFGGGLGGFGGF